ncbi:hypothetical protein B0T16DRAFT_514617 [Cercophora newfieldiana]|uniref:Uncharacterized protein n=1 Tax=Cercophora newfieldiana TaxID=92897 RepID=A0AA39XUX0_9PEZI|nr:hypothetical protein B0T16DRAFT_514617 [Cercophora newfieldiana]
MNDKRHYFALSIKNTFRLRTLLALSALIQTILLTLLPYSLALLPALFFTLHSAISTLADTLTPSESPLLHRVIPGRTTAVIPSWYAGGYSNSSSGQTPLVVFHMVIGFNHPLGVLCPGGRAIASAMNGIKEVLDSKREEFGVVGWSKWMGMEREAGNKMMMVVYFRTASGLEKFAACEEHREAVEAVEGARGYVSVVHETFEAAPGRWGFVAVDSEPVLLGDGACRIMDEKGAWVWVRSLVRDEGSVVRGLLGMLGRGQERR